MGNKKLTHKDKLLALLKTRPGEWFTIGAILEAGVGTRFGARAFELRKEGWNVECKRFGTTGDGDYRYSLQLTAPWMGEWKTGDRKANEEVDEQIIKNTPGVFTRQELDAAVDELAKENHVPRPVPLPGLTDVQMTRLEMPVRIVQAEYENGDSEGFLRTVMKKHNESVAQHIQELHGQGRLF